MQASTAAWPGRARPFAAGRATSRLAADRPYAERDDTELPASDRVAGALLDATWRPLRRRFGRPAAGLASIVARVDAHDAALRVASDAVLHERTRALRRTLRHDGLDAERVGAVFALVREAAARTLGKRHHPTQLMGGWAMLQGRLIEMATGEGKTFAATLPAAAMALAGVPVHVVTVNDYLARRDADEMAPLYAFLGLAVGAVVQGQPTEERRAAYAKDITYCTNKELAFDYLRDRTAKAGGASALRHALQRLSTPFDVPADHGLVLRGLHYAIVDEADSVFVDEARTPLILSASAPDAMQAALCEQALALAATLSPETDYVVDPFRRSVTLHDAGRDRIEAASRGWAAGVWASARGREELLAQALCALRLYRRDAHYVVAEGKVQIVDESTGRVMPDRSWERGLHQLIEAKEGCALTQRRDTLARLTYQRLFRRYLRLAGMTGTAREVAGQIETVYRLPVVRIPLHRPARRTVRPTVCTRTCAEKWQRVAAVAAELQRAGRPVLIGTRSVAASEQLSAVLTAAGVSHALLNAKQDASEAQVVAGAGAAGRVTVATNMAGRGTDIVLGPGVAERGGLHVVLTEYHESARIDRQLYGRCARQSDPGSCQAIVSLEDELFTVCAPRGTALVAALRRIALPAGGVVVALLRWLAQRSAGARQLRERIDTLRHDRQLQQALAFSGRGE